MTRRRRWCLAPLALAAGCVPPIPDAPLNPSFPLTMSAARAALDYDQAHPKPLRRPLLIVGGFADPGFGTRSLLRQFRAATGDDRIVAVSLGYEQSWAQCRLDIVAAVDAAFPTADPGRTTEVDVIGASMGGLAARYAAVPPPPGRGRRLRIARLFTLSSPLRGAVLADGIPLNVHPLQAGMRTSSWVYQRIADAEQRWDDLYSVYSYVRLRDDQVGPQNAAVVGAAPWWVSAPPWPQPTHHGSFLDRRFLADVAARLRGDQPLSRDPPASLPSR